MRFIETSQQRIFYTNHGWIELEIPHDKLGALQAGRDLWRQDKALQQYLLKTIGPIALAFSGKKQLRLACDHYYAASDLPKDSGPIKHLMSIQGFSIGVAFAKHPKILERKQDLGIIPSPKTSATVLFFRPDLILDWKHLASDVYIVLFSIDNAVYVHNPKDPHTNALKALGYNFGDTLKSETHPLIHA
jgi:hypothetical protein